ncbi:MAG: hypothetical protein QOE22_152 [Candidatus Parcubacteria bacterium]|nr:hypothetical protein [Candidatus Parcubacteria bacterium]
MIAHRLSCERQLLREHVSKPFGIEVGQNVLTLFSVPDQIIITSDFYVFETREVGDEIHLRFNCPAVFFLVTSVLLHIFSESVRPRFWAMRFPVE